MQLHQNARSASGVIESLEPRRMLDGGNAWQHGEWHGVGITTTSSEVIQFGAGYADASLLTFLPTVAGMIDQNALLRMLNGHRDADLDGVVNLADFNRLAANFGLSAGGPEITGEDWAALAGVVAQPSYVVEGRTLVVRGTSKADQIVVDADRLAEMKAQYPTADIRRISVDAGAGDDSVTISVGIISTVTGARGNDTIVGSGKGDVLSGSFGDDVILGGGGDDRLDGIDGRDHLEGGVGNDSLSGGKGHDTLMGNDGNDALSGGGGTDQLFGGRGRDSFKSADVLGNADRLGFDRRNDDLINSDADDEHVRDER